jgi:threonylcarbamoyladenosine tRNA methylthiotransferase MtaB
MKYSVITFGCRVNQADSLAVEEDLRAAGATAAPASEADLVIVNTCSVTASADQGARQTIRRVARTNPQAKIVVTGCYATRRPDELASLPNVVRVVSNDDKPQLVPAAHLARLWDSLQSLRDHPTPVEERDISTAERFGAGDGSCGAPIEPGVAGRTAFTMRVQTGCGEHCSYCIIPTTRGRPRSLAVGDVLRETARAAAAGFKDIALTGVHLGSYGRDLTPASCLYELLAALGHWSCAAGGGGESALETSVLFRISSLEPMDCTREIVDLVAGNKCFAPHFHLPLQHASDPLLASMRRPYTIAYFAALAGYVRGKLPHASIGSDVIVGFPGETEETFEELASYVETSPLTHLHIFPYSDRPGTEASAMSGKVPGAAIRERARRLRALGARLTGGFHAAQIGTVRPALTLEDGSLAVTDNYMKVRIPPGRARNERIRVRITGAAAAEIVNW